MRQGGQRGQDQEGAQDVLVSVEVVQERDSLDGLAKAHLICEDAVPVLVPIFDQPVETLKLELLEHSVVFEDGYVLAAVLPGLLTEPIEQVQLLLHFGDVGVFYDPVLWLLVELEQKLVDFVVDLHPFSGLTVRYLVPVLEL